MKIDRITPLSISIFIHLYKLNITTTFFVQKHAQNRILDTFQILQPFAHLQSTLIRQFSMACIAWYDANRQNYDMLTFVQDLVYNPHIFGLDN